MAQKHAAAVLGGGAPNGALMAGALCAIYDRGKTFHEFYASGAGAVISLAFLAARDLTPDQAMRDVVRVGVHDAIYNFVPLAFKTFFKSGPFTVPLKQLGSRSKVPESGGSSDLKRLYNDWVDLVVAAVTPTTITPSSQALCSHYPFINESLDFKKLKDFRGKFYMNSYCIETGKTEQFSKDHIGPEHFCAALSYPFIYPPTKIGNRHYYEGAASDPLNLPRCHRLVCKNEIDFLVVVDLLGAYRKALIRTPRNLLDAYGISILLPVVAMADKDMTRFMSFHKERRRSAKRKAQARLSVSHEHDHGGERHQHDYDVEALTFTVPPSDYPTMCDWSYSNMRRLWDIGYQGGVEFVEKHGHRLPDHAPGRADPV
jgi:predicted acylesterase/phospholipase RssA